MGVGVCLWFEASPEEIDELNIYNATQVAMNRALSQLVNRPIIY